MTSDDWIEFSFLHQDELHVVYSSDDADEMIAAGALKPDTRVTAFLPEGNKVMVAKELAQLPFAPPPPAVVEVEEAEAAPTLLAAEPEPTAVQSMRAGVMPYVPPHKERVVKPVSTLFKTGPAGPVPVPQNGVDAPPPAWLAVPVWQQALHRAFDFKGRSTRLEYWSYTGMMFLGLCIALVILSAISKSLGDAFLTLAIIALFVPNLAVLVRRLHDSGLSGWLVLIGIIPYIGTFALLIFAVMPSSKGANAYGEPSPR